MANIDFPSTPSVGQRYTFAGVTYTYTAQGVWSPGFSVITQIVPQGRLTLQSGVPVMTSTTSGVTSVFYTPYLGNKVPVWNGNLLSSTAVVSCLPELIAQTVDTSKNPSPIGPNKVNDWFVWNDAGTVRLSHGVDWTNDTTRAAALVRVEGLLLNATDITNGPASPANATGQRSAGTYVGTTMSNANSQLDWIYGVRGVPCTSGFFSIWNMYNRAFVSSSLANMSTWVYSLDTVRPIGGDANAKMTWVSGIQEDTFLATYNVAAGGGPMGGIEIIGAGFDSMTAMNPLGTLGATTSTPSIGNFCTGGGRLAIPGLGKHYFSLLEQINVSGYPQTIYGNFTVLWFDGRM